MLIKLTQKQNRTIHPNKTCHGSTIHPTKTSKNPLWEEPTLYIKSSIEHVFLMVHHLSCILALAAAAASSALYTATATSPCIRKLFTKVRPTYL